MDQLTVCYETQVRLREEPELLATMRWRFAAPDAPDFPIAHAFGSSVWETNTREYPTTTVGEVSLTRTLVKDQQPALPFPGGSSYEPCVPLEWFVNGVPADAPAVTEHYCCPGPLDKLLWWYHPAEIQALANNAPITSWPGHLPGLPTATQGHFPPKRTPDGSPGAAMAIYASQFAILGTGELRWHQDRRPGDFTSVMVAVQAGGIAVTGVATYGVTPGTFAPLMAYDTLRMQVGGTMVSGLPPRDRVRHIWLCERSGTLLRIFKDGALFAQQDGAGGDWQINGLQGTVGPIPGPIVNNATLPAYLLESIGWGRVLTCEEKRALLGRMGADYGITVYDPCPEDDLMIGAIVEWPGDTIPAHWLECDGARYLQADYPDLFAVVGYNHGPNLFDGTFAIPDRRGRFSVGVGQQGAGHNYALGETGGQDFHVLTVAELPAHGHALTDPQHNHGITDPQHTHVFTANPHTHVLTDPQHTHVFTGTAHNHGVTDPQHNHGVTDAGHTHDTDVAAAASNGPLVHVAGTSTVTTTATIAAAAKNKATGLTVNNASTGLTVNNATAAGTNAAASTGITIANTTETGSNAAAPTGVSVNNAPTGITIANTGGGNSHENRPSYYANRFIIRAK